MKHYVEHNYHDHAHDPVEMEPATIGEEEFDSAPSTKKNDSKISCNDGSNAVTGGSGNKKRRGHRGGVAVPFPEKLHFMLSRMDREGNNDIVTWQPHGRCFIVRKPTEFVEKIMPRYVVTTFG